MDPRVLEAQEWVNGTYGGRPGYVDAPESGLTGWSTMFSLTRALQIELGIATPSDTFGPATLAAVNAISPIGTGSATASNVVKIVQCALWCKGYAAGNIDGDFGSMVAAAVGSVQTDLGVGSLPGYGTVNGKLFKTLLTMDPYIRVGSGTNEIRAIQQWLNLTYIARTPFYFIPTDGRFSRSVQTGLIFALQFELGLSDTVANGAFGPTTRSLLQARPTITVGTTDGSTRFVRLFQAALTFNGYAVVFDGNFGPASSATTLNFQEFAALSPTGTGNYQTWCSLLVSTGDVNRPWQGLDTIASMIAPGDAGVARVAMGLRNLNTDLRIVGRYLTNAPISGALNKRLQTDELLLTNEAGLEVFPIYQTSGSAASYFTYLQGTQDAAVAAAAAWRHGFESTTRIYFAVDFDATDDQITASVLPYFAGVASAMGVQDHPYLIGVYGTRNTCAQVLGAGSAQRAFVAGMSTGWSGNLGYPLPPSWAFDQIVEQDASITVPAVGSLPSYSMSVGIDHLVVSDLGSGGATSRAFERNLDFVQSLAVTHTDQPDLVTCHPYRVFGGYTSLTWAVLAGAVNNPFMDELPSRAESAGWPLAYFLDDPFGATQVSALSAAHMMASMNVYVYQAAVPEDTDDIALSEIGSWLGDLSTFAIDWVAAGKPSTARAWTATHLGVTEGTSFDRDDLHADLDAANAARYRVDNTAPTSTAIGWALDHARGSAQARFTRFVQDRFGSDETTARAAVRYAMTATGPLEPPDVLAIAAAREQLMIDRASALGLSSWSLSDPERIGVADGFVDLLWSRAGL